MTALAPTLEAFFVERLGSQRHASPNTIASYRDSFRLLLNFAQQATGIAPAKLQIEMLDAPLIGAFLDHLERQRQVAVTTRNARLAASSSVFSPSPPSAATIPTSPTSPEQRSRHSSPHQTPPPASADVTGHSCSLRSRPGCVSRSS